MDGAAFEMEVARLGARQVRVAARGPAAHRAEGHVGVELEAERVAPAVRLHREVIALGEQLGAMRQLESLAMPMIDLRGPVRAERQPGGSGTDRIIADLDQALRMRRDGGAQLLGQHLRAEADADERPLLAQGDFDPVDLAPHIVVAIIGAHRATQNHGASMFVERFGQEIAETRTAKIERMPKRAQRVADSPRGRTFLMQNDQHRPWARFGPGNRSQEWSLVPGHRAAIIVEQRLTSREGAHSCGSGSSRSRQGWARNSVRETPPKNSASSELETADRAEDEAAREESQQERYGLDAEPRQHGALVGHQPTIGLGCDF